MRVRGCVCGRVRVCAKCVLGMYTAPSARTWSQCPALARPLFSRSDEPVRSRIRAWAWKKVSSIRGSCGRITASERCRFSRRPSQASSTQPAQRCARDWGRMRPSLPFLAPTVTTSPPETDPRLRLAWECFRCLAQRPSQASLVPTVAVATKVASQRSHHRCSRRSHRPLHSPSVAAQMLAHRRRSAAMATQRPSHNRHWPWRLFRHCTSDQ